MKKEAHGTLWLCHVVTPFIMIPVILSQQKMKSDTLNLHAKEPRILRIMMSISFFTYPNPMHGQHVGTVRVTDSIYSPVSPCTFFYHTSNISHLDHHHHQLPIFIYYSFFQQKEKEKEKEI